MSRIQIQCDRCGKTVLLPVRQNHMARIILAAAGWVAKDVSSNQGAVKEDYCSGCRS